ncbi:MAG TPA: SMC-Scp complex subunit ScpB [Chloroflexi bacterium]|nr:SMC-Scp complex subunit ScpB [Chloroflexota bacterium]
MSSIPESPPELSLLARLEALLFAAPGAVTAQQLAAALDIPTREARKALDAYAASLEGRGIRLQRHQGRVQLTTAPEAAPWVERLLGLEATTRLSRAALETLAIIAYRQPVTRPQINAIRGVNSDGVMKSLLSKGLIEERGRAEGPGRPILYGTTADFLLHFGLNSLDDLPPLNLEEEAEAPPEGADTLLKG